METSVARHSQEGTNIPTAGRPKTAYGIFTLTRGPGARTVDNKPQWYARLFVWQESSTLAYPGGDWVIADETVRGPWKNYADAEYWCVNAEAKERNSAVLSFVSHTWCAECGEDTLDDLVALAAEHGFDYTADEIHTAADKLSEGYYESLQAQSEDPFFGRE